jgi:type I restriction enzyme M protein
MLDTTTKRKLDSARQILVGKVPDPKAQVEQITTALIYKFMDDMDKENEDVGLKTQFFVDDWKKFSWTKILDNKLSGQDRLDLYVQAITNMPKNPHIPQLFRNIFKGAFLPYNDPRTLSLFLKEINEFNYEHSENLGNAFEYLLSILGSQGDAGQFRTPRHIIDFIVEVVDPKKDETILDPACGTAGFLISAYKHILKQNKEKALTPDEKLKLMNNLAGYDISPDMVKLALVNMYLHGFPEPKIDEYDTLSSEKRWDETFDVIMANPPFMTPKGGIVPHKRFSIQANRAEVLFVDYIVEHLTIKGRAGIIVPEGVIFQSNNAYTQLRKKLVEDGLFAVVSLPAGVFNPYAGVKTSILLFDNEISKKTKNFLFLKIQNDGFDLGAQRREHNKNDLPFALEIIKKYKSALSDKNFEFNEDEKQIAHFVSKEKIIATGDYNLSGDRYKEVINIANQKWEMVVLGEVIKTITPPIKIQKNTFKQSGKFPIIDQSQEEISAWTSDEKAVIEVIKPLVIFGDHTCVVKYVDYPFAQGADGIKIIETNNQILPKFLYFYLKNKPIKSDGYKRHFAKLKLTQISLPPIEVQEKIVDQIEKYRNIVDGARMVVESWKPSFWIDPKWEIAKLGDISERVTKGTTPTTAGFKFQDSGINFVKIESIDDNGYFIAPKFAHIDQKCNEALKRSQLKEGDVLFSIAGALGRVALVNKDILPANTNQALAIITPKGNLNSKYLEEVLRSPLIFNKIDGLKVGIAQYNISLTQVSDFEIPLPSLEIQKQIVAKIEVERKIVEANKKMIEIYDQKISDVLSEI